MKEREFDCLLALLRRAREASREEREEVERR